MDYLIQIVKNLANQPFLSHSHTNNIIEENKKYNYVVNQVVKPQ
jgi:hypothetical protein